jgi:dynein heavy chain 1
MIELCGNGEKTLERFRYQFPDDWLYSDQLIGEWGAYNDILKRKNDSIQEQLGKGVSLPLAFTAHNLVVQRASS